LDTDAFDGVILNSVSVRERWPPPADAEEVEPAGVDAAALDKLVLVVLDEPQPASSAAAATVASRVMRLVCNLRELIVDHIDAGSDRVLPTRPSLASDP
jgi:hypothetical protein